MCVHLYLGQQRAFWSVEASRLIFVELVTLGMWGVVLVLLVGCEPWSSVRSPCPTPLSTGVLVHEMSPGPFVLRVFGRSAEPPRLRNMLRGSGRLHIARCLISVAYLLVFAPVPTSSWWRELLQRVAQRALFSLLLLAFIVRLKFLK